MRHEMFPKCLTLHTLCGVASRRMAQQAPVLNRRSVRSLAASRGFDTITELAEAAGVHRVSLYRALSPTAPSAPSVKMLQGLSRALGAGLDQLLVAEDAA